MFDVFTFSAVLKEIKPLLQQERIKKIYQPSSYELLVHCGHSSKYGNFFISCNPSMPRFHLTRQKFIQPHTPPPFCMLLRKHLEGAKINDLHHPPWERILLINLSRGSNNYKLVAEIMGRHSNIILLDENETILGALKHITPEINKHRVIFPGVTYELPPSQNKYSLENMDFDTFKKVMESTRENTSWQQTLVSSFQGISPLLAEELEFRALNNDFPRDSSSHVITKIWEALQELLQNDQNESYNPVLVENKEGKSHYAVFDYLIFHDYSPQYFNTVNQMLDYYYQQKFYLEYYKQLREKLKTITEKEIKKIKLKEERQKEELLKAREADNYRLFGELILTHMHLLTGKHSQVELPNLYDPNQENISIPMEPSISPQENARRYFQKYRKLQKGEQIIKKRLYYTRLEKEYLENVLYSLGNADLNTLEQIHGELTQTGYIKKQRKQPKEKQTPPAEPLAFESSTGFTILVGQSNLQNDEVTFKKSSRDDTWLHVQKLAGSHVIIKGSPFPPDEETLLEAATLAAYYSKGRSLPKVTVDYTQVKNVNRSPVRKPGMAVYKNFQSISVEPEGTVLEKLFQS